MRWCSSSGPTAGKLDQGGHFYGIHCAWVQWFGSESADAWSSAWSSAVSKLHLVHLGDCRNSLCYIYPYLPSKSQCWGWSYLHFCSSDLRELFQHLGMPLLFFGPMYVPTDKDLLASAQTEPEHVFTLRQTPNHPWAQLLDHFAHQSWWKSGLLEPNATCILDICGKILSYECVCKEVDRLLCS